MNNIKESFLSEINNREYEISAPRSREDIPDITEGMYNAVVLDISIIENAEGKYSTGTKLIIKFGLINGGEKFKITQSVFVAKTRESRFYKLIKPMLPEGRNPLEKFDISEIISNEYQVKVEINQTPSKIFKNITEIYPLNKSIEDNKIN